jgi:serine/threonine-protein kinase
MTEAAAAGAIVGPYRLGRVLGRGGMAVVYEATHESIGRIVALKLLGGELARDAEFADRFRREGQVQAALEHPHVVTVYEAGGWEHGLYLAMQVVPGPTLAALIDRGALTVQRTLALHRQVAEALDAAHAAGLVHRDVKPRNVLVAPGDHAYLADFGLTKVGDTSGPTVTGHLLGTVAYLSPEVIRGEPATSASDRYAFAAMLFECLTGTVVFPRPTHAALLYAHTSEPPPRISARRADLPAALDDVFIAALAKQPAGRPASAAALVAEVQRILLEHDALELGPPAPSPLRSGGGEDTTAPPRDATPPADGAIARSGRRPALVFAAGLLLGALVAVVVAAVVDGDGGAGAGPAGVALAPLRGARVLGSDLARPGRTVDCRGARLTATAPACTIFQDGLGDATLVVPSDGVVRRWALRSARGEFALSVLRRRGAGYFQIARSRNEFATDDGPQTFATDLAVDRGDRLGLVMVAGSAVGVRPAAGATSGRWIPPLRGAIVPSEPGPSGELLFRVDYQPGGAQRFPKQVNGAAAARLPAGKILRHRPVTMRNGVKVAVDLVALDGLYKLDLRRARRRVARLDIPELAGQGQFTDFTVAADDISDQFYVLMSWVAMNSERVISHYLGGNASEFDFVD